jgi:hypothetical protein
MTKRIITIAAISLGLLFGSAQVAMADQPKHKCSPGQQGNPHPGFKPGVCTNK